MNKVQKFEYNKSIERYLNDKKVRELFKDLIKQLIVKQPADPIQYLIDRFEKQESKLHVPNQATRIAKRIIMIGPPGTNQKRIVDEISNNFTWTSIKTGDVLLKEADKKTEAGMRIKQCLANHEYCDDEDVIACVEKQIKEVEQTGRSWILQGFPRTKYQAVSLQRMGIIPDRLILLKQSDEFNRYQVKENLIALNSSLSDQEVEELTNKKLLEFSMHVPKVKDVFNNAVFELDSNDKTWTHVELQIRKQIALKFGSGSPKQVPKIVLLGPPGAGKQTQGAILAQTFGLIHVSVNQLLKKEQKRNPPLSFAIQNYLATNDKIPEQLINQLVQ